MSLIAVEDAQERLLAAAVPITASESVTLQDADGRVLAQDLKARLSQPPFNASAMDGYAIRAADLDEKDARLKLVGESAAGHAFSGELGAGEAVRIFTGAPVPEGADCVILQEDVTRHEAEGTISSTWPARPGQHVRPLGQDFLLDEVVLAAGSLMDFSRLTVAAGMNHAMLEVYRKPRVALLATGDELRAPGSALEPSQIVASSTFGIAALIRRAGAEVLDLGIIPDDQEAIQAAVEKARHSSVDVIVTLGGASVGDHDLVQSTLVAAGMKLDFWRIAMRPGKPLMVGRLGSTHVVGLPGNPVASLVCGMLFLAPLIRRLARLPDSGSSGFALAGQSLAANGIRQDYIRAKLERDASGQVVATPFSRQDSSMMKIFAQADCLIVRPPEAPELPQGAPCPIIHLHQR